MPADPGIGVGTGGFFASLFNPGLATRVAQHLTPNPNPLTQQGGPAAPGSVDSLGNLSPPPGSNLPPSAATQADPVNAANVAKLSQPDPSYAADMMRYNRMNALSDDLNHNLAGVAAGFGTAAQQQAKTAALGAGGGVGDSLGALAKIQGMQDQTIQDNEKARFMANAAVFAKTLGLPVDQTIELMNSGAPGIKFALDNAALTSSQKDAQAGASEYAKSKGYDDDPSKWTPEQKQDVAGYKSNLLAGALGGSDLNQRQYLAEKAAGTTTDDFATWQAKHKAQADILTGQANDVKDARNALPGYNASLDDMSTRVDSIAARGDIMGKILADPVKKAAAATLLNAAPGSYSALIGSSGLEAPEVKLIDDIRQMKLQNYSANFKSGQRLTQQEASRLGAKADQLSNLELDPKSYMDNVGILQKNIKTAHANAYGAANSLDDIPPELRPRLDKSFLPGGVNAVPGTTMPKWATPVPVNSVADIKALPKGQAYKIASGSHAGEVHWAGVEDQED